MDLTKNLLILLSRICICAIYLWAASAKLMDWDGAIAYMQSKQFPLIPIMLPAAVLLQIGGGVSLLLGLYCRWGAAALILFTIPAMILMHNFWQEVGPAHLIEKMFFMKDLAIVGGLFALTLLGPGKISFDGN